MVNIITGLIASGNDIRQSLNNISQTGEYDEFSFLGLLNGLITGNTNISKNNIDSFNENTQELQSDITGILASELHPSLNLNNFLPGRQISEVSSGLSLSDAKQLLAGLLSSNPELKQKALEFLSENQPLPAEITNLLENFGGTENYGIIKDVISALETSNSNGEEIVTSEISTSTDKQLTKGAKVETSSVIQQEIKGIAQNEQTNSVSKDSASVPAVLAVPADTTDSYYTFEPRVRQISSNFNALNPEQLSIQNEIPEDNNMAFVSGFIAGRQSYNKTTEKQNTNTNIQSANQDNSVNSSAINELQNEAQTEPVIVDFANPKGNNQIQELDSVINSQATKNTNLEEIPDKPIKDNSLTVSVNEDRIDETDKLANLPKSNENSNITRQAVQVTLDKQEPKQQPTSNNKLPEINTESNVYSQDTSSEFSNSDGKSTNFSGGQANLKEYQKLTDTGKQEEDFSGIINLQKTEAAKSKDKVAESKPGTSQELHRIRLSEFPSAAVRLVKSSPGNTVSTARLSLKPESLGSLDVKISMSGDSVSLSIKADSKETMKSLESQISVLKERLSQEGIKAENIELSYNEDSKYQDSSMKKDSGGFAQKEFNESKRDFLDSFRETESGGLPGVTKENNGNISGNRVYIEHGSSFVQYV